MTKHVWKTFTAFQFETRMHNFFPPVYQPRLATICYWHTSFENEFHFHTFRVFVHTRMYLTICPTYVYYYSLRFKKLFFSHTIQIPCTLSNTYLNFTARQYPLNVHCLRCRISGTTTATTITPLLKCVYQRFFTLIILLKLNLLDLLRLANKTKYSKFAIVLFPFEMCEICKKKKEKNHVK